MLSKWFIVSRKLRSRWQWHVEGCSSKASSSAFLSCIALDNGSNWYFTRDVILPVPAHYFKHWLIALGGVKGKLLVSQCSKVSIYAAWIKPAAQIQTRPLPQHRGCHLDFAVKERWNCCLFKSSVLIIYHGAAGILCYAMGRREAAETQVVCLIIWIDSIAQFW